MGTAVIYNEWEDVGLAFTDEQVAAHDPQAWASARVNHILDEVLPSVHRCVTLADVHGQWWKKAEAKFIDVATWYCRVAEIPGIDRAGLREKLESIDGAAAKRTAEGKRITARAQAMMADPLAWAEAQHAEAVTEMRCLVTISRRASTSGKWAKRDRSLANKVANAAKNELEMLGHLVSLFDTFTK